MPCILEVEEFSQELLPEMQGFRCGPAIDPMQYETALDRWIEGAGDRNVIWSMSKGTRVWLYYGDNDTLVGYASLGESAWSIDGARLGIAMIPALAIQHQYRSLPADGPKENQYAHQIMRDILHKAAQLPHEFVGLLVDRENTRAQALYCHYRFVPLSDDPNAPRVRMLRRQREPQ